MLSVWQAYRAHVYAVFVLLGSLQFLCTVFKAANKAPPNLGKQIMHGGPSAVDQHATNSQKRRLVDIHSRRPLAQKRGKSQRYREPSWMIKFLYFPHARPYVRRGNRDYNSLHMAYRAIHNEYS